MCWFSKKKQKSPVLGYLEANHQVEPYTANADYYGQGDVPAGYMTKSARDVEYEFRIAYKAALQAQQVLNSSGSRDNFDHTYNGYSRSTINSLVTRMEREHTAQFGYVDWDTSRMPVLHTPDMPDEVARGLKGLHYKDQKEYNSEWEVFK